jgi:hypothetical protein
MKLRKHSNNSGSCVKARIHQDQLLCTDFIAEILPAGKSIFLKRVLNNHHAIVNFKNHIDVISTQRCVHPRISSYW